MWKEKALCKGHPDLFYFEVGGRVSKKIIKAKSICAVCPVLKECTEFISVDQDHYGIWAGLTPKERRAKGWWKINDKNTIHY